MSGVWVVSVRYDTVSPPSGQYCLPAHNATPSISMDLLMPTSTMSFPSLRRAFSNVQCRRKCNNAFSYLRLVILLMEQLMMPVMLLFYTPKQSDAISHWYTSPRLWCLAKPIAVFIYQVAYPLYLHYIYHRPLK